MTVLQKSYTKKQLFQPEWYREFEHFNQMDAASFYLGEFLWEHRKTITPYLPQVIVLNSFESSHYSDLSYTQDSKVRSPSKFIYTLPSIKINVICSLLDWEGAAYCFIGKPKEDSLLQSIFGAKIWVIDFKENENEVYITLRYDCKKKY